MDVRMCERLDVSYVLEGSVRRPASAFALTRN